MKKIKKALRAASLALALAGCNYDMVSTGPEAQKAAASALVKCRTVCPSGTAPMMVTTVDSEMLFSTHYSCGCLALTSDCPTEGKAGQK